MRIVVINLEKNKGRMLKIGSRLDMLGVSYQRLNAIYGKNLSKVDKDHLVDKFGWWCVKGYMPRDGEIGCSLSHLEVYKQMLSRNEDTCCILEDDACPDERFPRQLEVVNQFLNPKKSQVVLLSNYTREKEDTWCIRSCVGDSSTEGYVLTKLAAKTLLDKNMPVRLNADCWRYGVRKGWFELYHAFPTVLKQEWKQDADYSSDVCPEHSFAASELSMLNKLAWKISRAFGKICDRLFYR